MNEDRYTAKAREALDAAHAQAAERKHPLVEPEHLVLALLQQTDGVVPQVVARVGLTLPMVRQVEATLARMPTTGDGIPTHGPRLQATLTLAQAEADRKGEYFVSTEHLLTALSDNRDATVSVLHTLNQVKGRFQQVFTGLRNAQYVPPAQSENTSPALEHYG